MIKRIFLLFFLLVLASPLHAEDYAKPSWSNLVQTLVRFNAVSLSSDRLLDEYAMITDCDLYKGFYSDDFKWNKVREAMRQSVQLNIATYPTSYHYDTTLQLDRYDFHDQLYRFTPRTTIRNINAFVIYQVEGSPCKGGEVKLLPDTYRALLDVPLYFEGLPLAAKDAEGLLQQMNSDHSKDHVVFTRFNLRVVYVEPMRMTTNGTEVQTLRQSNSPELHTVRLDSHLDSIDFYEDELMTKLIYHYQP